MSFDAGLPAEREPPPLPPRRGLRRASRWLVPVAVLCVVPLPVAAGMVLVGAAWATTRAVRAARERASLMTAGGAAGAGRGARTGAAALRAGAAPMPIEIGRDSRGRVVHLDELQLGAHGLILGASGSGKSTTLVGITAQQILQGRPMVVIDMKGSAELEGQLRHAAEVSGRPLRVWTLDGGAAWNPLAHGNPTELKDRLIGTERFSEPHYQRAAERYVQTAIQVMSETEPDRPISLSRVVRMLDPAKLRDAARGLSPERRMHVEEYVRNLSSDQLSAVRGLQSRLAVISESHTGPLLEPGADAIDLRRALDGPEIVLFSLNSSSYPALSAQIGALAVQDLVGAAGARERSGERPTPATVAIDEFTGLGGDHVLSLIARGRSAGVSVLISTQEMADLDRVAPGFRQQVIGSTAVKIAHRQDVTESAHDVARLAGTEQVWEASYSREQGLGTRRSGTRVNHRLVERPRISAATVQSLPTGDAVVITKVPQSQTRLTRIRPLQLGGPGREARERGGQGR